MILCTGFLNKYVRAMLVLEVLRVIFGAVEVMNKKLGVLVIFCPFRPLFRVTRSSAICESD